MHINIVTAEIIIDHLSEESFALFILAHEKASATAENTAPTPKNGDNIKPISDNMSGVLPYDGNNVCAIFYCKPLSTVPTRRISTLPAYSALKCFITAGVDLSSSPLIIAAISSSESILGRYFSTVAI